MIKRSILVLTIICALNSHGAQAAPHEVTTCLKTTTTSCCAAMGMCCVVAAVGNLLSERALLPTPFCLARNTFTGHPSVEQEDFRSPNTIAVCKPDGNKYWCCMRNGLCVRGSHLEDAEYKLFTMDYNPYAFWFRCPLPSQGNNARENLRKKYSLPDQDHMKTE